MLTKEREGKIVETLLIVSSVLLWIIVLLNLVLTFALVRRLSTTQHSNSEIGLKAGEMAPNFTAQTLEGEIVTLSKYVGRKVAFVFISTTCNPCREILPHLELLKPKAVRAGFELLLVSGNEMEDTQAFVKKEDIGLPVLVAPASSNSFMEDYKSTTTPSYCIINERGRVQSAGYPAIEWGEWKTLTDAWNSSDVPLGTERR